MKQRSIIQQVMIFWILVLFTGCTTPTEQDWDSPSEENLSTNQFPTSTSETTITASPTQTPDPTPIPDDIEITFINNAGFLITAGDYKIIIDGIYGNNPLGSKPPTRTIRHMIDGETPFTDIDLVLITHNHFDHFDPDLVVDFLINHPESELVTTQSVVDRVIEKNNDLLERCHSVSLSPGESEKLTASNIDLNAYYISHGDPEILNLGFLINLPGGKIFHTGDLVAESVSVDDLSNYELPGQKIDIALIPLYLFEDDAYHEHINLGIQAQYIIPMHYSYKYPPTGIETEFPNAIVFTQSMQTWVMPIE